MKHLSATVGPTITKLLMKKRFNLSQNEPTISEVLDWLLENNQIWIYIKKEGGWWTPVIENYYDEDDRGTIIENLSKMDHSYRNSPVSVYKKTIEYALLNLC